MLRNSNIILAAVIVMVALVSGRLIAGGNIFIISGLLLATIACFITFQNPENGLILLVFSMILSPEIELAKIPRRSITVRIDDFLLIAVFITYLTYHAATPTARKFAKTPINRPLIAMVLIYFISTAIGIAEGRLTPVTSFFFVLKYIQYFIIFWLTANIVSSYETIKKMLTAGAITAVIGCIYAYSLFPTEERVYLPFDSEAGIRGGEAGTMGGYLLIVISLALSFFMNSESKKIRFLSLGLCLFILPPFVRTLSRASYYSLAAVIAALIFYSPKRKGELMLTVVAVTVATAIFLPDIYHAAVKRIQETFWGALATEKVHIGPFTLNLEMSAALRVDSWKKAIFTWFPNSPIIGHGATGVGLVDAQLPRILGEFGLAGIFIFIWLIGSVFYNAYKILKSSTDELHVSLTTGFIAGLVGLLVQSIGVNTFIIVRIMTPFWFLCALVVTLPKINSAPTNHG